MKRDNKLVKFTTLVLLITIVAVALVSGTYAKYTSSASGEDTATVAKWSILLNEDEEIATKEDATVTFDLFNTVKDSNGTDTEGDVTTVDGKTLIAPGTSGKFDLKIKNASEVTAQYAVSFVESQNSIPLKYRVNGGEWKDTLDEVVAGNDTKLVVGSAEATVTVEWQWAFDGDDTTDTGLGIQAQGGVDGEGNQITVPSVTVTATITATQVD